MGLTTAALLVIVLFVGTLVGWNARTARGASADLKIHKARIPNFRRVRTRSGLLSIVLVVLTLLVVRDLIH